MEGSIHQGYSVVHQDITREPNDLYNVIIYAHTCKTVAPGIWLTMYDSYFA